MALRFDQGTWTVGHYRGTPIRLHWTLLLVGFLLGRDSPGAWLGLVAVVLVHELGHALVVRAVGAVPAEIVVHGFGGHCAWRGTVTPRSRALIAWGGVAAQLVLFLAVSALVAVAPPRVAFTYGLVHALTTSNLWIAALNLIPVSPFDGAEAWRLFPLLLQGRGSRASPDSTAPRPASAGEPRSPKPAEEASSSRVTSREESERLFKKVYDGMKPPSAPASERADDSDDTGSR